MTEEFTVSDFNSLYPNEDACLEKIKKLKFPKGVLCVSCKKVTPHYKVKNRKSYTCKLCRTQIYPLKGTLFEKSSTPLRLWFFALYLMVKTRADISAKQLQRELGVTYKTAWRIYTQSKRLMAQNNGDLLTTGIEAETSGKRWTFFKRLTFSVVEQQKEEN